MNLESVAAQTFSFNFFCKLFDEFEVNFFCNSGDLKKIELKNCMTLALMHETFFVILSIEKRQEIEKLAR